MRIRVFGASGLAAVCGLAMGGGAAVASVPPPAHEQSDKPRDEPGVPATAKGPAFSFSDTTDGLDVYVSQVNVSALGLDIIGDAGNEPTICVDPTAPDRVAIAWRQFDTILSSFRQAGNACSLDGGRTWHNNPPVDAGVFRSDPVLAAGSDGTFYLNILFSGASFRCDVATSTDGGQTWSVPRFAFGGDKAWMTIDRSGGIGDGILHQAWSTAANPTPGNQFSRSIDGAQTWATPSPLTGGQIWGTLAVGNEGELYVVGQSSGQVRVSKSLNARDPGAASVTFQAPATFGLTGPVRGIGGVPNPGGLIGQIWIDVDRSSGPRRGRVYVMAAVDPAGVDQADISMAWSDDGGATWSPAIRVNTDAANANNWQWFPAMSVAPNGRLDATWYSTHEAAAATSSRLYYSASVDGGVTWSPAVAIGPVFDTTIGWPNQNKIGDYTHQVSDLTGCSLAWSATFTGGQDVYFARIGAWDCNGNGVADDQDITLGTAQDCNGDGVPDSCQIAAGYLPDRNNNQVPDPCESPCEPDLTHGAVAGRPGYGVPDALLNSDDFFYYLAQFAAGNVAVADLTTVAVAGQAGFGVPNGVISNDDFFYYLLLFASGC